MTLATALRDTVRRHGGKPAFQTVGKDARCYTYGEAYEQIARVAGALRERGLAKGDRVAVIGENSIDLAFVDWACYSLGLVVVPIYPTLPAETTQYIVRDSGAKLVVVDSEKQAAKVSNLNPTPTPPKGRGIPSPPSPLSKTSHLERGSQAPIPRPLPPGRATRGKGRWLSFSPT